VSSAQPTTPRPIPTFREALKLAYARRYPDARALYLWLLARAPSDAEARAGLARVDAWDGCWGLAEREFREALSSHPEDSDVRAGLIDLFIWEKRWDEATRLIDDGLFLEHDSPALLLRRARLLHWGADDSEALDMVRDLQRRQPEDPELRALRDDLFVGQATVGARADAFPGRYPNIYTLDAQLVERWRKLEVSAAAHLVDWTGGGLGQPIVDGERSLRVAYHPAIGFTTAVEAGFGNPGVVLPRGEVAAEVAFPLYGRFTGVLDYAYWAFSGGVSVHIFNPTLAYEATDDIEVAAHAWLVHVGVGTTGTGGFADTWGAHVGWKATPRLRLLLYYTYGVQLDRDPTFVQLFNLRSHVVTGAADWLVTRDYGVRGLLGIERRAQDGVPSIVIGSVGGELYVRW
jgi:tetratricopeptide (TPR) repeat protein